jgi:hypothetical protein
MTCEILTLDFDLAQVILVIIAIAIGQILYFFIKRTEWLNNRNIDIRLFLEGLSIRNTSAKAISIAMGATIIIDICYFLLRPADPINAPKFSMISTVLLHPIVEEFLVRGLFFASLLLVVRVISKTSFKKLSTPLLAIFILIQAILFAQKHEGIPIDLILLGVWCGILFMGHKKIGSENNLIPPILAHATHNALIAALYCGLKIQSFV